VASRSYRLLLVLLLVGLGLAAVAPAFAQSTPDQLLFGPKQYLRTSGHPHQFTNTFTVPASIGAPFLLHIVNGDAAGHHRISSAKITLNGVVVVRPRDFSSRHRDRDEDDDDDDRDEGRTAVGVIDRIVTLQATNTLQVKLRGKPGSFLTISVFGTKILPTSTMLAPNPLTITVGATGTLTATLSPTPTTAGTLSASSANIGVATVPASVAFAVGQSTVPVPVTAVGEGSTGITVSLNGGSASSTVHVNPSPPTITSLLPSTVTITQGGSGTLTVTISAAQSTDTIVALASSNSGVAFVPAQITVLATQTQASFTVNANTPGSVTITASVNGTSVGSTITVTPAPPTVVSLLPPTNPVTLGASTTLTVTISAAQATDTVVAVTASPAGIVTVPAAVTVPAGQTSVPLLVGTVALGAAMVQASLNGTTADSAVQVVPPAPAVVSLLPSPLAVVVGATGTLTVTLNAAQLTNTVVTMSVDQGSVLQVPVGVTVAANQTQTSFTVTGLAVGTAVVTATVGSTSQNATVQVIPPPPMVVSLLPNPLMIQEGATGSFTLTINAAQLADTAIPLTNSASAVAQVPASATVPAGQASVTFPVTGLTPGSATVTASINASSASATVQVAPPPTVVTALTPASTTVPKGTPAVLHVAVVPASTMPQTVTLTSNNTAVATVPATVPIPTGALGADFPVIPVGEGTSTITATLNGSAVSVVVVTPAELVTLTLLPQTPTIFIGQTQAFTATGTFTDGTTRDLTTSVAWSSSNQVVATINSSGVASALAAGTTTIKAASGSITAETTLTVLTPPALSLTPAPASLRQGDSLAFTVTSAAPSDAGGLVVTLTQSGTGSVTVPQTVLIPEGLSSTTFTVTGAAIGSVTVTATAPIRLPASSTLTVTIGVPTVTGFTPTSGPVGTAVTITGTKFDATTTSKNAVKFNGTSAIVSTVTTTSITTTVPQGATTGSITVTTPQGTGTSPQPFTVTPRQDFTLSAVPAQATVLQGGQTSYVLNVTGIGTFTGLVSLSVTGLPTGVTAQFTSPALTAGQNTILVLTATAATPVGAVSFVLNGTASLDTGTQTKTVLLLLQVLASGGQTAVSGQFLSTVDGSPIPNVQANLGAIQSVTDAGGNFLLQNVPAGTQKIIFSGTQPNGGFMYSADIVLTAGQNNVLPPFWITPQPSPERFAPINNAAADQVFSDPRFPGLSLTLPAGVTIIGWNNVPKTQIALERLDLDRLGVPPPPGPVRSVYQPFFGTPMGGYLSPAGAVISVSVPNDLDLDPGQQVELWVYDATPLNMSEPSGWKLAGMAMVSLDGTKIVSNTGVGITRFCYKCGLFTCVIPAQNNGPNITPGGSGGGDPVDLRTGQFTAQKTDMVLPGRLPVTITRTYTTVDPFNNIAGVRRTMGLGWALSVDVTLFSVNPTASVFRLILPPNSRLDLTRQVDGTYANSVQPFLKGAVLNTLPGGDHQLRFKDGTTWQFRALQTTQAGTVEFLIAQTDRNGNTVTINRASGGMITSVVDVAGRVVNVTSVGNRITQTSDPLGRTLQYSYDNTGRLSTVADPAGGVTRYTYDSAGRILTITDPKNIQFLQNFYGTSGRVLRQVQADGSEFRFRYQVTGATVTGPGCPGLACPTEESWDNFQAGYSFQSGAAGGTVVATTVVDPKGNKTTRRFNNTGYDSEVTDGQGQPIRLARDGGNQVTASTDALGRKTSFTYDAAGNTTSITDPDGKVTRFAYELTFNRVTKITDALNQVTTFTYDVKGNLLTTADPLNQTTRIVYNTFGQPTSVTDPLNNVTTFDYDGDGNLITTTDPLGNHTQRTYDTMSRLSSLTNPLSFTTQFTYDGLNRVTQITDALNGLTAFSYDPNGNLLTVTDAKGQATTYTYDSMDRLKTRTDALNRQETYGYDLNGNLNGFTDRKNQQSTFTYDALNRRIGAGFGDGSSVSFIYDSVGRLSSALDSVVGRIEFVYDNLDRLIQETTPQGSITYAYDALGRRITMTANGQQPVSYGYDAASRLVQVQQGALVVGIGYDAASRRTLLTYPNATNTSYSYDAASRLLSILHQGSAGIIDSLAYTYDAAGNRINFTRTGGAATQLPAAVQAAYDAANEQIQFNSGTPNNTFDANGNLTSETTPAGIITYTYDVRNRLIARTGPGINESYSYDALGRRISKTINGVTTSNLYDGNDIIAEIGGGAVGATYLRSLNIDEPFVRQSSANEFYHTDALGSTLALSNTAGAVATSYSYEPFGRTQVIGTSANPFQYTGRENDGSGLYYYRARYYSPSMQRFLREDPLNISMLRLMQQQLITSSLANQFISLKLRYPQDLNPYIYVYNNPLIYIDPFGHAGIGLNPFKGIIAGGTGELIGGITGSITGAGLGAAFIPVPGGFLVGGFIGGQLGAAIGGLFDPPCAGELNCGEVLPSSSAPLPPPGGGRKN
jgi:RHS repeat-associated protein